MSTPTATPFDPGLTQTAQPSRLGADLALHSEDGWLRWSRFTYELPPDQAGRRRTLWRQLKRLDAVKLGHGDWALGHDEHDDPGIAGLVAAVERAGGSCQLQVVGHQGIDDVERNVRLCRSCEDLWDPYFNHLDRVARARREALSVADVDRLRLRYLSELARDIVLSDAARRAADRLDELGDLALDNPAAATETGPALVEPRVEVNAGRALDNGTVRYIAQVLPMPSVRVERAFAEFERATYQPSPGRVPLRHGAFLFSCPRAARDTVVTSLQTRVQLFATARY